MKRIIGKKRWAIAEGYIPATSHGPDPEMTSHESVSILNTNEQDAHITITVYYTDKQPVGPYEVTVPAERTKHVRFNNLDDPSRFRRRRPSRASSSRTCRSSANTPGSTPDSPRMRS